MAIRFRGSVRWIATAALVLAVAGSATAQQPAPAPAASDAQVGFERRPQLTPQEQLTQAETILAHFDTVAANVRRQLEKARNARDVVKTLCLNDKLSQIDVANRSARDRQAALQVAVQRGDGELAGHEFTILTVLRQRVDQLNAEANQCLGEEMAFIEKTQVTLQLNLDLPGEDNTAFPPTDMLTEPPLMASAPPGP